MDSMLDILLIKPVASFSFLHVFYMEKIKKDSSNPKTKKYKL